MTTPAVSVTKGRRAVSVMGVRATSAGMERVEAGRAAVPAMTPGVTVAVVPAALGRVKLVQSTSTVKGEAVALTSRWNWRLV
jgi:hypothetical protein